MRNVKLRKIGSRLRKIVVSAAMMPRDVREKSKRGKRKSA